MAGRRGRFGDRRGSPGNPWTTGGGSGQPLDVATEAAELVEALVTVAFALAGWLVRHPAALLVTVGGVWWWRSWGWPSLAVAAGAAIVVDLVWWWVSPRSFERVVWSRVRTGFLRAFVYELRWSRWARASRLVVYEEDSATAVVPRLRSVRTDRSWDEVRVRMLPGQRQRDYEVAAEGLAQARKVARCAVREVSPGVVSLGFLRRDPLVHPVGVPEVPPIGGESLDLRRVVMGETEFGQVWQMPLLGSHTFGAGMTGAGKGSLLWQPIRMVAPAIRCGRVRVSMIDPKGGMEAEIGEPLFGGYARDEPETIVELLTARVDEMRDRAHRLRGRVRKLEPTVDDPLELVVVDELAAVTKYLPDKKKQVEAERLLGLLLSQGRALAVSVVAFVQEPTKDVVPFRGLFPYRIGLRLDTPLQADMVLGDGAWASGAWCDRIGVSTPGVGYVVQEGVREPLRVRAAFTDDAELRRVAASYSPRP